MFRIVILFLLLLSCKEKVEVERFSIDKCLITENYYFVVSKYHEEVLTFRAKDVTRMYNQDSSYIEFYFTKKEIKHVYISVKKKNLVFNPKDLK